jgi:hypothetical protein
MTDYKNITHCNRKQLFLNISATILLVFILLRWFFLIDTYSVNMLFWDQWDFLEALFANKGPWELFSWQHGPPRQGIGFFLTKAIADLSGWNTRVESFMIGAVVCLAALTAVFLKLRLVGNITVLDVIIPLFYLSPLQFGLVANTQNVSHGAMPLLLVTLFCLCWTIKNITLRYALCAMINFMTIYTGFGIFIGCIVPLLFLSEIILAVRLVDKRRTVLSVFFFLVSIFSMLSFFINYTFNSAAEGFIFPAPDSFMYIKFILITFATYCGIRMSHIVSYIIATPVVIGVIYAVVRTGLDIVRSLFQEKNVQEIMTGQIILVPALFTLIFSLNLAIGRVCLGLGAATASRYTSYMTPAFFSLYLFAVTRKKIPVQLVGFCIICFFITTFSIGNHNRVYAERLSQGKQKWKQTYLQTENILLADRLSGFEIHPNPQQTHLKEKLDYLKKNKLNLYLTSPKP